MLALTGLACHCAHQMDRTLLGSVGGTLALLYLLTGRFDAPPATEFSRASSVQRSPKRSLVKQAGCHVHDLI